MLKAISQKNSLSPLVSMKPQTFLVEEFQKQVANSFNLFLNYKHYHWQTFGPFERDLNIIFDEFANEVYSSVEELAQTVRMMGQNRVRIKEFRKNATVKPAKMNNDLRQMIKEADLNLLKVIGEVNDTLKKVAFEDSKSAGILRKMVRMYEKQQWWLHYILNKRQGLSTLT